MADTELVDISTESTTPAATDLLYTVDSSGSTDYYLPLQSYSGEWASSIPGGRLTLTTATPVTTSDVTAATTLYYTPYIHDKIDLYDGTTWKKFVFTERSLSVPASTDTNYDIWLYDNSGTLTLEALAWTNDTTRATALAYQDGALVKSGATTRRYLGTFRTTGVSGQTEDSQAKRLCWNMYNRVPRRMRKVESTANWVYAAAIWRYMNNSAANRVEMVVGEGTVAYASCQMRADNSGSLMDMGLGLDWTTGSLADNLYVRKSVGTMSNAFSASFQLGIGFHYIAALESSHASVSWYGDSTYGIIGGSVQG